MPIVRHSSNRDADAVPLTQSLQYLPHDGRISHKFGVAKTIQLELKTQTVFMVTTGHIGLI